MVMGPTLCLVCCLGSWCIKLGLIIFLNYRKYNEAFNLRIGFFMKKWPKFTIFWEKKSNFLDYYNLSSIPNKITLYIYNYFHIWFEPNLSNLEKKRKKCNWLHFQQESHPIISLVMYLIFQYSKTSIIIPKLIFNFLDVTWKL